MRKLSHPRYQGVYPYSPFLDLETLKCLFFSQAPLTQSLIEKRPLCIVDPLGENFPLFCALFCPNFLWELGKG